MLDGNELKGNAQILADMVADTLDCDIKAITLTGEKYPSSYYDTIAVATDEKNDNARPKIEDIDVEQYDTIILVYPLWWFTIPMPVASFLENNDFEGKTIWLLATQGSSGFASSTDDVKKLVPNSDVHEGLSIYCDDVINARDEIEQWLSESVIKGKSE